MVRHREGGDRGECRLHACDLGELLWDPTRACESQGGCEEAGVGWKETGSEQGRAGIVRLGDASARRVRIEHIARRKALCEKRRDWDQTRPALTRQWKQRRRDKHRGQPPRTPPTTTTRTTATQSRARRKASAQNLEDVVELLVVRQEVVPLRLAQPLPAHTPSRQQAGRGT
eukprot:2526595-Rhodomonas_salina.1